MTPLQQHLKGDPPPEPPLGAEPAGAADARTEADRVLVCAACGSIVARDRDRIEMDGAHVHTFVNPSAVPYRIGCFGEASGCIGVGEVSSFWSWFRGFAWQVAVCARCAAHLGWLFRGGLPPGAVFREPGSRDAPRQFFGLIVERLAER